MGKSQRWIFWLLALALLGAGCDSGDSASSTSTSTSTTLPASTTSTAPTTTTTEPDPCGDRPFCVVYEIADEAVWSDETPVTSEDFVHTLDAITDPVSGALEQTGYQLISDVEILDDKRFIVSFSSVFPSWRTLFEFVLPAHSDLGYLAEGAPVSGPFMLEEWIEGERIVLTRNPRYWSAADPISAEPLGNVEQLVFVFPDNVRDQLRQLENGEVDVVGPRPLDWMIDDLDTMEQVSFDVVPGAFWEHIDFNHDDPLLGQPWVREAISSAIDREAILDETVRAVDEDAPTLDSAVFLTNSAHYEANYERNYDPERAERLLQERFCELGDDDIYNCQGRRLSFRWATTVGDEYRETIFELVSEDLADVGIELTLQPFTPSELFSSNVLFGEPGVWQMINFSWKGEPDPFLGNTTFYCTGDAPNGLGMLNVNRYCDETVEALVRSTENIIDVEERVAAYNEADALYLADDAIVPLFQKPALLAFDSTLSGPEPNISSSTDLWNVSAWRGAESVVIALESEPDELNPLRPQSDSARIILAAMLHGAFGVSPELEFRPVLLSGAEPSGGPEGSP
jgi:peptide/nickel transport system substrate-binding protein